MHAWAGAGRVIGGRYRLRDLIGRGAMGAVWRARDELLDRDVAVKEVHVTPALSEHDRSALYRRTLREAKTAARLSHPGVVTVFDVVEEDARPWIVMELVEARSLDQVLVSVGPLPADRAAGIGLQLAGALATAHAAGVLHRDVKPSNVLLAADERAVLTDFGIATFEGDERLTQTGMVMGTPSFTPPERIRGEPATGASDLWSLGATLYAAVAGSGPFQGRGDAITTMNAVLHEDPPAAPAAGRLGPVIAALMSRDPAARPDAARAAQLLSAALRYGEAGEYASGAGSRPAAAVSEFAGAAGFRAGDAGAARATSWDQHVPGHVSFLGAPVSDAPPRQAFPARPAGGGPSGPGRGTGRAPRGRRRVALVAGAALVVVAAGVAAGLAVAHATRSPGGASARGRGQAGQVSARAGAETLPAGYRWYSLPAASAGATAGFRLAVPQAWGASTTGLTTYLRDPAGPSYLEIDLTPHTLPVPLAQAHWLELRTLKEGKFPGYRRISIRQARVAGSAGALWTFTWVQKGLGRVFARDCLFDLGMAGGTQSYAVYESAPAASWQQATATFAEAIRTFQPLG